MGPRRQQFVFIDHLATTTDDNDNDYYYCYNDDHDSNVSYVTVRASAFNLVGAVHFTRIICQTII